MDTDGNNDQELSRELQRRMDAAIKEFFKNKERIAEVINKTVFEGKYIIDPDRIVFLETELAVSDSRGVKQPRRDIVFGVKNPTDEEKYDVIVNFEGQGKVDFSMAFRSGDYAMTDCKTQLAALREQQYKKRHKDWLDRKNEAERKNKEMLAENPNAIIEKFSDPEPQLNDYVTKDTKLPLYISIVFHYGPGRWTAGLSTKSLMEGPSGLAESAPEWHYMVIDPAVMDDDARSKFTRDIRVVLELLKVQNKTEEIEELLNDEKRCGRVGVAAGKLIHAFTDTDLFDMDGNKIEDINNYKGDVCVCKGMQGVLQKTADEATEMVYAVLNGVISGMTDEEIHDNYGASPDQIARARATVRDCRTS